MNKNDFVSEERLYLDKDGNVVGDKDPNKLTLLVSAGGTLPYDEALKYGLVKDEGNGGAGEEEVVEDEDEEAADEEEEEAPKKKPAAKKAPARKR